MSCAVECQRVVVAYGARRVLDALDWRLSAGEIVGLIGYSGAGKTTLLRALAGLTRCDSGRVLWDDSPTPPRPGRVGMVFQNLALWPHLTARRQVECVLPSGPSRRDRAEALLAEVCLPPAAWDRAPAELSGGESQRLALARALASQPELLLLDEPLAHLDEALRGELRALLADLLKSRGTTAIYVTHAWQEVAEICPRIAVLWGGRIGQEGSPADLYWRPASIEVARLAGPLLELPAEWIGREIVRVQSGFEPGDLLGAPPRADEACLARPQQLRFSDASAAEGWRVLGCQPYAGSWLATLSHGSLRWQTPCAEPFLAGDNVSVEILPVGRFCPRPADLGELKSPSGCGTRNSS